MRDDPSLTNSPPQTWILAGLGECSQEAERVREVKITREINKELLEFSHNPHPDIPRGKSLPPNAGITQAMKGRAGGGFGALADTSSGSSFAAAAASTSGLGSPGGTGQFGSTSGGKEGTAASRATGAESYAYIPKDQFSLYSTATRLSELQDQGIELRHQTAGNIGFEQRRYEEFVNRKAAGTLGQWELSKKTMKI